MKKCQRQEVILVSFKNNFSHKLHQLSSGIRLFASELRWSAGIDCGRTRSCSPRSRRNSSDTILTTCLFAQKAGRRPIFSTLKQSLGDHVESSEAVLYRKATRVSWRLGKRTVIVKRVIHGGVWNVNASRRKAVLLLLLFNHLTDALIWNGLHGHHGTARLKNIWLLSTYVVIRELH